MIKHLLNELENTRSAIPTASTEQLRTLMALCRLARHEADAEIHKRLAAAQRHPPAPAPARNYRMSIWRGDHNRAPPEPKPAQGGRDGA